MESNTVFVLNAQLRSTLRGVQGEAAGHGASKHTSPQEKVSASPWIAGGVVCPAEGDLGRTVRELGG